jgi:hypothetical protein
VGKLKRNLPKRKRCSKCRKFKSIENFLLCKTGKQGRYRYCKECQTSQTEVNEKLVRKTGLKKLGLKTCLSCHKIKELKAFYSDPRKQDGKQGTCKECFSQKGNDSYLRKEYGITLEQWLLLLDAQDGLCAVCGRAPKHNKFTVDHCHKTHRVRALVCVYCNTHILPIVERFPEWVKRAFTYLQNPPAFAVIGEIQVPETNRSRIKEKTGAF